ncbi:MAG: hypothetical protein FWD98_02565 [Defluviitaleaceae bacterium]|nr:hypothetical protein [Defluviitaleaceae bacterium]
MAYADKLLRQIFEEHLNNLHTSMPCEVVEYYPDELKADVQPLFKRRKGGQTMDYPMIEKVPVVKSLVMCADPQGECECGHYFELEPGQEVLVFFAERALDFAGDRRHDMRDALVVAVIK